MRILLTGASGQVGHALFPRLARFGEVIATASPRSAASLGCRTLDLADPAAISDCVRDVKPQIIVNAGAYTAVDKAETDAASATAINAAAPERLAAEAAALGAFLIHYSTDYVYAGLGDSPQVEDASIAPANVYGRTKRAGEEGVASATDRYITLRTSWVFSDHGSNFVKTMLRLGAEREALKVVADQVGAPTSADFLARMTSRIVETLGSGRDARSLSGVYNLCCAGNVSWAGFAEEIFRQARTLGFPLAVRSVEPIPTSAYPTPAKRPSNSRLDCSRFRSTFAVPDLQSWQDALKEVLETLATNRPEPRL